MSPVLKGKKRKKLSKNTGVKPHYFSTLNIIKYFACILLIGLSIMACSKEEVRIKVEDLDLSVEKAKDAQITYSDSASIKVMIEGPIMLNHVNRQDPQQEFTDGVKVTFYNEQQVISSILTAKYGIRVENKGEVIVRDSVVWQSMDERRLETEELIWDERLQKIYTNRYVAVMLPPADTTYHLGFEADQDFKDIKFKSTTGNKVVEELSKTINE